MEIILFQPQIPQNTGNVVRTCSVTNTQLTLVGPLGFSTSSRMLKRAGLDYWDDANIQIVDNLETYLLNKKPAFYFFSSKATKSYHEVSYQSNDILIFGSETSGLPSTFFTKWPSQFVTIPILNQSRCLNLSNSVCIGLFEALRQQNFASLKA
jgi:tRNA (cytidine/uridine-2'-O-)-methyltransferase